MTATTADPSAILLIGFEEPSNTEPPASIASWKPNATSKANIENKIKMAALRKEDELAAKAKKAAKFTQKASKGHHLKKAQDEEGVIQSTNALQTKISSASSKRLSLKTKIVTKLAAKSKKTKARKARMSEEDSDKLMEVAAKANERVHAAETRKELQQAKQVETLVQAHQSKIVAAAEAKHHSLVLAQDKGEALEERLAAAQARKELLVAEQVEALVQARQEKVARVQETRELEEYQGRDGSARLANKIQAAEDRRAKALQVKLPIDAVGDKAARVEALKASDNEKAAELLAKNTEKLSEAADRRTAVLDEKSNKIAVKAQANAKRLENQKATADIATSHLRDLLDAKMAIAEENRQGRLSTIVDRSNSSFAFSSPSKSPITTKAIERKLEAAAARRDMHLLLRSASKRNNRSLMAGDLPSEEEDIGGNLLPTVSVVHSPPTKKPRLENMQFQGGKSVEESKVPDIGYGPVAEKRPQFNILAFLGGIITKLVECFRR